MSSDDSTSKVHIPALGLNVPYQNWSLLVESALMTKGLLRYIKEPLLADAVPPPTSLQLDKRTQAFGFILLHLSFSERQAIEPILALNTQDAYTLWLNIKERHERVTISRVWASWKRLNAAPETTLSDPAGIDAWFTGTIAAYNAYRASGRQLDEYTACLIMLDNLPEMWGAMRRSITQSGNDGNTMTFAVLRNNMESELITRKSDQQLQQLQSSDVSQALVAMRAMMDRPQSARRQPKRPRVIYQRTPGATCTKCKKPNHTAQQCGKAVEASDQKADGTAQMTSSDNGARRRTVNLVRRSNNTASFDDYFDSDEPQDSEVNMTTDSNDSDDSSALATTKDYDNPAEPLTRHWLVDCGASHNYCNDPSLLSNIRGCNAGIKLGNGQRLPVIAEGEITLTLPPHGRLLTFTARYVPDLRRNLLSVGALGRQDIHVLCAGAHARIFHAHSNREIGRARCINTGLEFNLYRLDPIHSDTAPLHSALICQSKSDTERDTLMLWHRRLGHSNVRRILQLFNKGMTADSHELQIRYRPKSDAHRLHHDNQGKTADGHEPQIRRPSAHRLHHSNQGVTEDGLEPQIRIRPDAHQLHEPTGQTADGQELQHRDRLDAQRLHTGVPPADSLEPQTHRPTDAHQLHPDAHRLHPSAHQLRYTAHRLRQHDGHCDSCAVCKHHAATRPPSVPAESRAMRPLETIHIDLRGPHSPGIKQELYQLLIVDECSHYVVGFTLQHKSDALASFERFATAANSFHSAKGYSIQFIRSDNGMEFIGADWTPLLTRLGIQRQRTSPYTPHQNGIVERLNRTIAESTRTMLHAAGLPARFWPLACQAAVYVHNRLPNKATGDATPYQLWHGKRPSIGHLRAFGCLAYGLVHNPGKLEDKATRCTFVGYPLDSSRTYLLWDNQQQKLHRSGHVRFIENINGWNYNPRPAVTVGEAAAGEAAAGEEQVRQAATMPTGTSARQADAAPTPAAQPALSLPPQPVVSDTSAAGPDDDQPAPLQLNRSQQAQLRRLRDTLLPAINDAAPAAQVTHTLLHADRPQLRAGPGRHHYYGSVHAAQLAALDDIDSEEPRSFRAAMQSVHRSQWLDAIRSELRSLIKAGTWRYAHKPNASNLVGCRWLFKVKKDKDGNVSKFKARLVAH